MSVMEMREEIQQVNDALQCSLLGCSSGYHRAVFDQAAYADIAAFVQTPTIEQQQDMIHAWCNRLYVANQCAYIFTYSHRSDCDKKINFIAPRNECHNGGLLLAKIDRFYRMLESIRYNLYSNVGLCMLCREDMDRLNNLIEQIGRDIVAAYQRKEAGVE